MLHLRPAQVVRKHAANAPLLQDSHHRRVLEEQGVEVINPSAPPRRPQQLLQQ